MKSFIAVVVVLSVFFAESHQQGTTQVVNRNLMLSVRPKLEKCAEDLKVPRVELDKAIANDLTNDSPEMQCLALCFFQANSIMNEKGELNVWRARMAFSIGANPLKVWEKIDQCKDITGTDPCNTAFVINKCMVDVGLL